MIEKWKVKKKMKKGVAGKCEITLKGLGREKEVYQRVAESQKVISLEENVVPAKS